eukprot:scaffold109627_cov33-Tisochrysis_lutea.AAC.2
MLATPAEALACIPRAGLPRLYNCRRPGSGSTAVPRPMYEVDSTCLEQLPQGILEELSYRAAL